MAQKAMMAGGALIVLGVLVTLLSDSGSVTSLGFMPRRLRGMSTQWPV